MTTERFVLATANPDKVAEIRLILSGVDLVARPVGAPDVIEDADDLEGNARLKAMAIVDATGLGAIADDTGLEVDALDGAPGVYSARFAGDHASYADNVDKLLFAMSDVPEGERAARFRTVALARFVDGTEVKGEGVLHGTITLTPRGVQGFGYDPVFCPDELPTKTLSELTMVEKNKISHRGRAFRALAKALAERD